MKKHDITMALANKNSKKVTEKLEGLILGLYMLKPKPSKTFVLDFFRRFMNNELDIVDLETGSFFKREDFTDANSNAIEISYSTVCNILRKPRNSSILKIYASKVDIY